MFNWLRRRKQTPSTKEQVPPQMSAPAAPVDDDWIDVPNYLAVDPASELPVSLIAAAVTADAQLVLRHLYVENPEAKRVGLIASAIAAGDGHANYVVKSIKKKVE